MLFFNLQRKRVQGGGGGAGEELLGDAARRSFSLKAANRLASGSPGSPTADGALE